ncbi:MAG: electron transfer flavoprotein subunit alpha/FixB family protein [Candidatus Thermoplasmatota archaeon]|nr:electron transfer flavoprotein subunit alpha/FixB family protein [Candidatus Thermoplasmatota archaeon]
MSTTIIAEQQEEGIHPTLPQLVHAASIIGGECTIIIPGGGGESEASEIVGVDRVLKFNGSCFSVFDSQSWSSALKGSVGGTVLLASTPRGRELGASLAADIGISVVQDITSISEGINVERPVFSGKAIEKVTISSPAVITIRPNSLDSAGNGASAPVSTIDSGEDLRMAVEEAITKASEKIDVSEADIIISGGRGLGDISNFEKLEEVASTLGAAVGASRAVVDEWGLPHSMQVGQTGKTVTPSLYIAVGISGAIQHLAGMRSSSYIVAINKDPEAPIFTVADYGIVASWEDALPVLHDSIKALP